MRRFLDWMAEALTPSDPHLQPHKGGHNDLSRWEQRGGTLKLPPPPAPVTFRNHPLAIAGFPPPPPETRPGTRCPECGGPRPTDG